MMPSFRQKVVGFIRQLSNQTENNRNFEDQTADHQSESFIKRYLSGQEVSKDEPKIVHGRFAQELPVLSLGVLSRPVLVALTGPDGGLTTVNRRQRHLSLSDPDVRFIDVADDNEAPLITGADRFVGKETKDGEIECLVTESKLIPPPPEYAVQATVSATTTVTTLTTSMTQISAQLTPTSTFSNLNPIQKSESVPNASERFNVEVAGVSDWGTSASTTASSAYGRSVSLYERHPTTGVPAGEPVADCFAVVARRDSAVLCLADGVNWGQRASLAARAAVHGCVDHLNRSLFQWPVASTNEVFVALLRSFHAAHNLILQEEGLLTTLTAVVVLPLASPDRYVACACNVGDSLAYVYSPRYGVREITQGSHDLNRMRDMRDALGALGPVDGQNPELGNLTCSMTEVEPGDIVFLTSDGVSDNLDPVVGKFTGLPNVEAHQRHKLTLLRTEDLLRNGVSGRGPPCSTAREVVSLLIDFVTRLTAAKRKMLEDVELYQDAAGEGEGGGGPRGARGTSSKGGSKQRARRREVCAKLAMVPGKLDHATVAAYNVGDLVTEVS